MSFFCLGRPKKKKKICLLRKFLPPYGISSYQFLLSFSVSTSQSHKHIMNLPFPAIFLIFIFFIPSAAAGVDAISLLIEIQDRERAPPSVQEAAARGVLLRLLPSHSSSFLFRIVSKEYIYLFFYCCCSLSLILNLTEVVIDLFFLLFCYQQKQCGGEYCFVIKNLPSFAKPGDPQILYVYCDFLNKVGECVHWNNFLCYIVLLKTLKYYVGLNH